MPGGDRTGPNREGPRTGRGMGYCSGSDVPGYAVPRGYGYGYRRGFRRGYRHGRGYGRGWRWGHPYDYGFAQHAFPHDPYFAAPPDPAAELHALKAHADGLKRELEAISRRMDELQAASDADEAGE